MAGEIALGLFFLATASLLTTGGSGQDIKHSIGRWDPESGLGNHRAIVRVEAPPAPESIRSVKGRKKAAPTIAPAMPTAARVTIHWRRRDNDPEKKSIIVIDAATGERVKNVCPLTINREFADIYFESKTIPGDYFIYYMPYKSEGRKNYPNVEYVTPQATADPAWLAANGLAPDKLSALRPDAFPRA
ncbi:MAG: DUF6067 family protein, partial [Candidatus Aminicenantes bacterium]|nr:DUF6067 family protein [Candidatus Aminicenantes bacterium]